MKNITENNEKPNLAVVIKKNNARLLNLYKFQDEGDDEEIKEYARKNTKQTDLENQVKIEDKMQKLPTEKFTEMPEKQVQISNQVIFQKTKP